MTRDERTPTVQYEESSSCDCGRALAPDASKYWRHRWTYYSRRGPTIVLARCCAPCCDAVLALLEAEADGRRYSEVKFDEPCNCGRATLRAFDYLRCFHCAREWRMLDRETAELRHIQRLLKRLRKVAHADENRRAA